MTEEKLGFVVQEHIAEKAGFHHDFRLEVDNTLESWAVPKGVPTETGIKRLAIEVADHGLDYIDFEGEIPEGYGKGTVKIFDKGIYKLLQTGPGIRRVHLIGNILLGEYVLQFWKGNNWLIWKR